MLIKIKTPGWGSYTGELGMTRFEDGVSVEHISSREAYSLGSMLDVVEVDEEGNEGNPVSHAWDMVRGNSITAPVTPPRLRQSDIDEAAAAAAEAAGDEPDVTTLHTQSSLEIIASEKGIAGLREIADPLGIKGTGIKAMIADILLRQPKA
jgi:hypothetical protein